MQLGDISKDDKTFKQAAIQFFNGEVSTVFSFLEDQSDDITRQPNFEANPILGQIKETQSSILNQLQKVLEAYPDDIRPLGVAVHHADGKATAQTADIIEAVDGIYQKWLDYCQQAGNAPPLRVQHNEQVVAFRRAIIQFATTLVKKLEVDEEALPPTMREAYRLSQQMDGPL